MNTLRQTFRALLTNGAALMLTVQDRQRRRQPWLPGGLGQRARGISMRAMIERTCGVALILLLLLGPACPAAARSAVPALPGEPPVPGAADNSQALDAYAYLPLSFIPNRGQWDPAVQFRASAPGATFYFAADRIVLALDRAQNLTGLERPVRFGPGRQPPPPRYVTLRFEGANPHPIVEGIDPLPGTANFFLGSDPAGWRSGLPTYGGVRYRDLYPGIDLVYRGHPGALKSEFVVAPGADPAQIRLCYEGVGTPRVDAAGRLLLPAPAGDLVEEAPVAFTLPGAYPDHEPDAASGSPVPARFVVSVDGSVGFSVGSYAPDRLLVIDPALVYSTFVGGSSDDGGYALALDGEGNAVVTGHTGSSDFPATLGAYDTGHNGDRDVFVLKLAADGSSMLYSTFVGGIYDDWGNALALDGAGNAVITGRAGSSDFPTTPGAYDTEYNGNALFVLKLSADGGSLLYSTFAGGYGWDEGYALALDGMGNAVVTGATFSPDFPTTPGAYDTEYNGNSDVFVLKLSADGSALLYSTFVGGSETDWGNALALDGSGNVVVTGDASTSDFPTTPGAYDTGYNGSRDVFVLKLAADGSSLLYSTFVGGYGWDEGNALALDGAGNAVVAGRAGSDFPTTPGAYDTEYNGAGDVFVLKLAADGSSLLYSTFVGGGGDDYGYALALDETGSAVVTGRTSSSEFPTTPGAYDTGYNAAADAFVLKLAMDGSSLLYSTFAGGTYDDWGYALALDAVGNAVVTGWTGSSDFPTTAGAYDTGYNGGDRDVFVFKLAFPPSPPILSSISNPGGAGSYLVDWATVTGATSYLLQEDDNGSFVSPATRYSGTSSQYQVSGQSTGTWYYRVRASNAAGDSLWSAIRWVTVGVAPQRLRIYLPLVVRNHFPDPYEPNDTFADAWGPLASGATYHSYFPTEADENDYYYFDLPTTHSVEIWLSNIPIGNDYDLYLYDAAHIYVDHSGGIGSVDEHVYQATLPAGKYYVRLTREAGVSATQPYTLRAVFGD